MSKYFKSHFFRLLAITLFLIACNNKDKKAEQSTTDSTGNTTTDAMQPATDVTPDAVKAAPNLYTIIKDTMGIRVLQVSYQPGDSSVMHSHPDYAFYAVSGGTAEFTEKDGTKHTEELKAGSTMITGASVHSVKNTGKSAVKVILVEVNRPAGTTPNDPLDATKVASGMYKVRNDSLGIRVVEVNYKPGQASAMHAHPDLVLYVVNGGTVEFTEKDGTKHTEELKSGLAAVVPAAAHSAKNAGKAPLKAILVEVGRPAK